MPKTLTRATLSTFVPEPTMSTVIVSESMSHNKPSPLSATPSPSTVAFPGSLSPSKSDALMPNPHPYPIKTTSTAVLSRSNSTSTSNSHQYKYQYYVPQSSTPSKELSTNDNREGTPARGDQERRGGRHRYSRSLNLDSGPKPLPAPPSTTGLFSHRNHSSSSFGSSSESSSPTKSEEEGQDVFGTTSSPLVASGSDDPVMKNEEETTGDKKKRGRGAGGKVKGIVASLERNASSRPKEDEEASFYVRREYSTSSSSRVGFQRRRTESDASVSSASSFGSFTDVKMDDGDGDKLPAPDADRAAGDDSTPIRNGQGTQRDTAGNGSNEEPTMEELLASTPYDPPPSFPASGATTIKGSGVVYDETVKLHNAKDVAYSTVTASSIRYNLPNADAELTVEELLALVDSGAGSKTANAPGASAWERDNVGCTVKRVGEKAPPASLAQDSVEDAPPVVSSMAPAPPQYDLTPQRVPPTPSAATNITVEREVKLVQEMSETREMVRALSARVASVEAKIGEMEVVAGELETRGKQLLDDRLEDDDNHHHHNEPEVEEEDEEEEEEDGSFGVDPPQEQSLPRRVVSTLYKTVFGLARPFVEGDGICASLVRMVLPFSLSSSSSSSSSSARSTPTKTPSRDTSPTRAVLPVWYKKSWASYLLFLGLGACAFVLREVAKKGLMLRGRRT